MEQCVAWRYGEKLASDRIIGGVDASPNMEPWSWLRLNFYFIKASKRLLYKNLNKKVENLIKAGIFPKRLNKDVERRHSFMRRKSHFKMLGSDWNGFRGKSFKPASFKNKIKY